MRMRSYLKRWFEILARAVMVAGVALALSSALPACESSTAPRFPPPDTEFEDEEPDDEEDDG